MILMVLVKRGGVESAAGVVVEVEVDEELEEVESEAVEEVEEVEGEVGRVDGFKGECLLRLGDAELDGDVDLERR